MSNGQKLLLSIAVLFLAACGNHDKITTTRVRPPVQASLPSSILANGSFGLVTTETDYSKTCQTDPTAGDACMAYTGSKRVRCIVKNRLFCKGPTEVLSLLNELDSKLEYVEGQSEKGVVKCMDATPVDRTTQISYPGSRNLTQKFQCKDASIGLGFGEESDTWYVRRGGSNGGQAFEISPAGVTHGYIWLASQDGSMSQSTGMLQITADQASKTTEITGGGVGFGFCGLHFKSNSANVYLRMNPDGVGSTCDYDQSNTTDSSDWVEACLDASSLDDADATACADLKTFNMTTMGRDTTTNAAGSTTWEQVAPLPSGTADVFELRTYLSNISTEAGKYEGVEDFKAEDSMP